MKAIIAGSRYNSTEDIERRVQLEISVGVAQSGFKITEVVSGGARGVDRAGEYWARKYSIPIKKFIPDWDTQGRAAGHIRNKQMAEYADILIAIWDGSSKGTKNMIETMQSMGKPTVVRLIDL